MSSELKERLARLGLAQYSEVFVTEGFDTWETVLDITESDLGHLNVKLGHRRVCHVSQRSLAPLCIRAATDPCSRNYSEPSPNREGSPRIDHWHF